MHVADNFAPINRCIESCIFTWNYEQFLRYICSFNRAWATELTIYRTMNDIIFQVKWMKENNAACSIYYWKAVRMSTMPLNGLYYCRRRRCCRWIKYERKIVKQNNYNQPATATTQKPCRWALTMFWAPARQFHQRHRIFIQHIYIPTCINLFCFLLIFYSYFQRTAISIVVGRRSDSQAYILYIWN